MSNDQNENTNLTVRDEFAAQQTSANHGTADTAVAAQVQAQVQARYIMAYRRPRSWAQVRVNILYDCKRETFARAAVYRKPMGGGKSIEGLSIRFAESAIRAMGNIMPETVVLYDDSKKRIVRMQMTDLESNVTYSHDITIEKTVERKFPKKGQRVLGVRTNSYGDQVSLVEANEGDLMTKEGALISKAMRNLALRILPGDLQDEAKEEIRNTLAKDAAEDPDKHRKQVADAFMRINVSPKMLEEYLGHPLDEMAPHQVVELRQVFAAIQNGETTWRDIKDDKDADKAPEEKPALDVKREKKGGRSDALAAQLTAKP